MNTLSKRIITTLAGCTFAFALLNSMPTVNAADQVKGGERMMQMMKPIKTVEDVQAIKDGDMVAMACPKCKTITYSYVDRSAKGASKEVQTLTKDACPGCNTKIVTTGVGKAAKNEIQHTCKECGSHDAFCCVLKKDNKAQ
ncbi:MAG: hypothetical protein ABI651_04050 [Verrucomicrobiota bacterium]